MNGLPPHQNPLLPVMTPLVPLHHHAHAHAQAQAQAQAQAHAQAGMGLVFQPAGVVVPMVPVMPMAAVNPGGVGGGLHMPLTSAPLQVNAGPLSAESEERVRRLITEGNMLRSRNKHAEAIDCYNQALKVDPVNVTALNCKGVCYKQMGRNAEAMLCYRDAIQFKPDDWRAHNNRGVIYKETGLFQEAIDAYALALEYYHRQLVLSRTNPSVPPPAPSSASNDPGEVPMPCDVDKDPTIQNLILSTEGVPDEDQNDADHAAAQGSELPDGPLATDCIAKDNMAIVLTDLGTRLKVAGNVDAAVMRYNEAIRYNPRYAPAYFNLGVVYSENNRFTDALKFYHAAVERNPGYVEALCNIGVICKNAGQLESAIHFYERALKLNPNFMIANNNLAIAYTDMGTKVKNEGRIDEGIRYYRKSLVHNPKYSDAWYNLGVAYAEKGQVEDAMVCYEMAITFNPNCAQAYNNLGVIYKDRGNLEKSIYFYQEALKANPNFAQTLNNLGVIYTMLGKLDEAYSFCQRAIATNPSYAEAFNNLGVLYRDEGRIREAIACYNNCLRLDPYSRSAGQNRLLAMNSLVPESRKGSSTPTTPTSTAGIGSTDGSPVPPPEASEDELDHHHASGHSHGQSSQQFTFAQINKRVFEHHRQWGLQFASLYPPFDHWDNVPTISANRVIRIGYVSADFFTHSVSYFIEAPLRFANHQRFYVVCYSNVGREDKKTYRLKKLASAWRSIVGKSSKEVAQMVRKDQIDILIDLTGHTAGNRLDVLAHKPAPVQVSWIGYPNTTGLPTIDYRFSDEIADPPDTKQEYVEELVRLPGPFLCYTPMSPPPEVSLPPALKNGFVTFGSFNNLAKINDRVLSLWARILLQVPNSRLLMKCKPFASESIRQKMLARFESLGVDPKRIDLIPLLPSTGEHLKVYSLVDISVDTFPYAGTTTTCESLFMGVPVITLRARPPHCSHAHNVGASLLWRIDFMREFIADSDEEYVQKAAALAKNLPKLSEVRRRLRPSMLASSLCDGETFTRNLEQVYLQLWDRWCKRQLSSGHPASPSAPNNGASVARPHSPRQGGRPNS